MAAREAGATKNGGDLLAGLGRALEAAAHHIFAIGGDEPAALDGAAGAVAEARQLLADLLDQRARDPAGVRADYEHLLGCIWLYVDWRYVTGQLTTEQKDLFADAIDAHHARINADHPDAKTGLPSDGGAMSRLPHDALPPPAGSRRTLQGLRRTRSPLRVVGVASGGLVLTQGLVCPRRPARNGARRMSRYPRRRDRPGTAAPHRRHLARRRHPRHLHYPTKPVRWARRARDATLRPLRTLNEPPPEDRRS